MFTHLKSILLVMVFMAMVVQLAGCVYDRQGRRYDDKNFKQDDPKPEQVEADLQLHG